MSEGTVFEANRALALRDVDIVVTNDSAGCLHCRAEDALLAQDTDLNVLSWWLLGLASRDWIAIFWLAATRS